jgi:hypothetical protein
VTRLAENQTPDCPPATQDIQLNLENRQNAIDNVGYGPLNPAEPNEEFWQDKAERWNIEIQEAKTALCGNCIFFIRTPKMLDCIKEGIGLGNEEAQGSVEAGELGYCNALDFKCASERTCNAWAAGGPVTDESSVTAAANDPCWDGYVQIGMKKGKDGKMVPNCVPEGSTAAAEFAAKKRTKAQTPAPKKDRIKGSKVNKKGSAASSKSARKVVFSKSVENSLKEKVTKHNESVSKGRKTTLGALKAVFRRGAGAYSVSHRPGMTRNGWAFARVNAFLKLLKSGKPSNSAYTTDNDLLPASHPRSSKKSNSTLTASALVPEERDFANALLSVVEKHGKFDEDGTGVWAGYTPAAENEDAKIGVVCKNCVFYQETEEGDVCKIISLPIEDLGKCRLAVIPDGLVDAGAIKNYMEERKELPDLVEEFYVDKELSIELKDQDSYENPEEALVAMAEYSQMGYEMIVPLRAAWLRAVEVGENPFERASELSTLTYESKDSDLLPRKLEGTF